MMSEEVKEAIKEEFNGDDKAQIEKAKLNLVYVGILSVLMFFGGLTSAYIVSMGDSFWVKFPLPSAFWVSTAIIILSSIVYQITISFAKKGNTKGLKVGATATLILGLAFVYTQFKGYGQLAETGSHLTGSGIIVSDGKYGDYFYVEQGGEFIHVDGNDFMKVDKELTKEEMASLKKFTAQFLHPDTKKNFEVKDDGIHKLYWSDREMNVVNGNLQTEDSTKMLATDRTRLYYFAQNIQDERGHFFIRGKFGKDFQIYFKGKELGYKNGNLTQDGQILPLFLQLKALESADTASSYLWGITIAHLLHIIVTLLYMTRLVIRSFSGRINAENNVSLRMGGVFWHFLGLLWLFLLLFLLFIH